MQIRFFKRFRTKINVSTLPVRVLMTLGLAVSSASFGMTMDRGAFMPAAPPNPTLDDKQLVFANPNPFELAVSLPPVTDSERLKMAITTNQGPQKIGIHREVPFDRVGELNHKLTWKKTKDGVVAYVNVRSTQALAIRFATAFELPAGATVSFYEVAGNGTNKVIYSFTTTDKPLQEVRYWSPHATGDSIGMEIRLSDQDHTKHVKLELLTIAHHFDVLGLATVSELQCTNHENVQCAVNSGEISEDNAKSALKLTFESDGFTYTCSATLMNVSGDGEDVYVPYVITAAHCISTAAEASSVVAWWNYQSDTCAGSSASSDFVLTFGGARLLATLESSDHTLIQLNEDAPAGAYFSGWWATDVEIGINSLGAHHPDGGLKKFFAGTTSGNYNVNVCDEDDNCILLIDSVEVEMYSGTSEGGSSGSGLRVHNQEYDDDLFVGVLSGSDSECNDSKVYFGQFQYFYPQITNWFNPPEPPEEEDGDDHGNDHSTATSVFLISETEGEIEEVDDVDYFVVEVDRVGTIRVYTTSSIDTVGTLSSELGDLEIEDDDSGDEYNFSISADVEPGVYYITVEGWGGTTGEYTLHVEFEADDDHGNFWNTATSVSSAARNWEYSTVGNLEIATDIDVFELTLTYDSDITIYTEGSTDTSGRLTNEAGLDLFENDDASEDDSNLSFSGSVDRGTYYLHVEGTVSESSEYKLIIEINPPEDDSP